MCDICADTLAIADAIDNGTDPHKAVVTHALGLDTFQSDAKVIAEAQAVVEAEDDGADYETYDPTPNGDDTQVEYSAEVPASLDEDAELPPYSIYARYWPAAEKKEDRKPLKYVTLACDHKLRGEFEPNHRNCERCWFTYFQVHGELTQAVEEAYQKGGAELVKKLRGPKFLKNFLKFMSTVAFIKAQQEAANKAAQEKDESTTGRTGAGDNEGGASSSPSVTPETTNSQG